MHKTFILTLSLFLCSQICFAKEKIDYQKQVAPILQKYCAGCHNADEMQGELALDIYSAVKAGGENGPVVVPGKSAKSLLIQVLTGQSEPAMPPDESEAPTEAEIKLLRDWIDAGAVGPVDAAEMVALNVPQIKPQHSYKTPITALDWSADGKTIALSSFQKVDLLAADSLKVLNTLTNFPGKVNSVSFSADGKTLVTGSGITGLRGEATLWNVQTGEPIRVFNGHRDIIYTAKLNPAGTVLATGSYDRRVILWNVQTGDQLQTLEGHNDAIYDLAFSPDGTLLVTGSGDTTAKVWHVETGKRLDTLGQPLKEVYSVAFSPKGNHVLAAGVDNRIRMWQVVSKKTAKTNPLLHARYAHLGPITHLAYSSDGRSLLTISEDLSLKQWDVNSLVQVSAFEKQPSLCTALAVSPTGNDFIVGRLDGTLSKYSFYKSSATKTVTSNTKKTKAAPVRANQELTKLVEQEPNDLPAEAKTITVPAQISGVIFHDSSSNTNSAKPDSDLYRFHAKAGEQWMMEIKAARDKSPLDSKIEVLDQQGDSIVRVQLKAVRDSYFTFRGKDSSTTNDFRVHNWEEMELNEYLYSNGEVVKLWLYPRGPDSGFRVYPGEGKRYGYFDTTPLSHALQEPCYIVEPYPANVEVIPNGLPVFKLYYENDDESRRRWGADSQLTFTAPTDGDYLVRVSDVRQFEGSDYKYELTIRQPKPDFKVTLSGENPTLKRGTGREFGLKVDRIDGFEGPITVEINDLPPGFTSSSPIVIQEGQVSALGTINASNEAVLPTKENASRSKITATAIINGVEVKHELASLGEIKLDEKAAPVTIDVLPHEVESTVNPTDGILEFTISPGETISGLIRIKRNEFDGIVKFGNDSSIRNAPHGIIIANVGLNGLMIPENQTEQLFFLKASNWIPEQDRLFHLKADTEKGMTTLPVRLKVRHKSKMVQAAQ